MNPFSLQAKLIILGVLALVIGGLAWTAHYYHNAYLVEHANFESFKGNVKALGEQAEKHKKEVERLSAENKEKADADHAKQDAAIKSGWAADRAERDRLRQQLNDSRSRPMPSVALGADLSCDKTSAERISAAVSEHVKGARQALEQCQSAAREFREQVAGQLERAESNTAALMCGIQWATQAAPPAAAPAPAKRWWQFGK